MDDRTDKTVFISYRRSTGSVWALAVYQYLRKCRFDVFCDYRGLASGDFEQVILANIKARAHFVVLLTPSALDRIDEPGDWLRREIEVALEYRRNIVPLMLDGFDFTQRAVQQRLTGSLTRLMKYSGLTVPVEYFDAAMMKLRTRYLSVPLATVLHPLSPDAVRFATEETRAVERAVKRISTVAHMRAAASGVDVTVFASQDDPTAEEMFTDVRRRRPNDYFATQSVGGAWRIHRLYCSSLAFGPNHKLTESPKVVAMSEADVLEWARRFGVQTIGCSRCGETRS